MCFGDLLLLLLMWAVSMKVWKRSGIDFMKLLSLEETEVAAVKDPFSMVVRSLVDEAMILLLSFILFNKTVRGAHRGQYRLALAHVIPVLLTIYYCYRLFSPYQTRHRWIYMFWKVICAPLYPVEFRDGYIGDLLTSLVRISVPFLFSLLYVILSVIAWLTNNLDWAVTTSNTWWSEQKLFTVGIIPFLTLYPLWIRFLQCLRRSIETGNRWPHLMNALKYTSAMLVISYASFQPELRGNSLWVACFIGATIYQFLWDIFLDWGMINIVGIPTIDECTWSDVFENFDKITFEFRKKRLLGPFWSYGLVMLMNLALRFAWTLTLLPPIDHSKYSPSLYSVVINHAGTLIAAAEIVRRMVWGFYRLEYEQIEMINKSEAAFGLQSDLFEQTKAMNSTYISNPADSDNQIELQAFDTVRTIITSFFFSAIDLTFTRRSLSFGYFRRL
jgi:hypothetical protein